MPITTHTDPKICIWQLNLNRSNIAQNAFLHTISPHDADLLLLQEPYINPLNSLTTSTYAWRVVYPTGHHDWQAKGHTTRSTILVSTRLPTDAWQQIPVLSPDITAIRLSTANGPVHISNIYNDQGHDTTLQHLRRATTNSHRQCSRPITQNTQNCMYTLWAGHFNRHHPIWELHSNSHSLTNRYLQAAEPLIESITDFGMQQLLPGGTPTLEALATGNHTRPDNVFADAELTNLMIACRVTPAFRPPNTDHYPIAIIFDLALQRIDHAARRNWRTDWDGFRTALEEEL